MDAFEFTQKKLTKLRSKTRNRHIINWLSGFYQKLTTNRVSEEGLNLFSRQYNEILDWMGMDPFIKPEATRTRVWIESISDRIHLHRCAMGAIVRDPDLLETIQTNDLSMSSLQTVFQCHLALDGLRSLFNVGSIFRTCDATGFTSIILGNTPGKEHPAVQKTAMGSHKWVEQEKTTDLAQTLIEKKDNGFKIIGVDTIKGARPFYDMPWEDKTILVFGNEEYGISSHVRTSCDDFVHIPMFGKKNSINVANAVAVICFQVANSLSSK